MCRPIMNQAESNFSTQKGTNLLTIKQTLQVCRIFMLYFILSFHQGIGSDRGWLVGAETRRKEKAKK